MKNHPHSLSRGSTDLNSVPRGFVAEMSAGCDAAGFREISRGSESPEESAQTAGIRRATDVQVNLQAVLQRGWMPEKPPIPCFFHP